MPDTTPCFVRDALGGTLARDHQSRAMFHAGAYQRTYVTYMDHSFDARVMHYDCTERRWSPAVAVDTVVWEDSPRDGHNAPNLFVAHDGTVHLFYGSHGNSFKYARTRTPEDITKWETGQRVGRRATYPFVVQRGSGELLLFYRLGGAQIDSPLVVQRSADGGDSWSEPSEIVRFGDPSSVKIHNVLYDARSDRLHFSLHERTNVPRPDRPSAFPAYYCQFDPGTSHVFGMNGADLGPVADLQALVDSDCRMAPIELEHPERNAMGTMDMCLVDGQPRFFFTDQAQHHYMGWWDGHQVAQRELPEHIDAFLRAGTAAPNALSGRALRLYGIAAMEPPADCKGGDVVMWSSTDGGVTWDEGVVLLDRHALGHGLDQLNLVMDYAGAGPRLIAAEPTGPWPEGLERTPEIHYDNPSRWNRRLYAVDGLGRAVS